MGIAIDSKRRLRAMWWMYRASRRRHAHGFSDVSTILMEHVHDVIDHALSCTKAMQWRSLHVNKWGMTTVRWLFHLSQRQKTLQSGRLMLSLPHHISVWQSSSLGRHALQGDAKIRRNLAAGSIVIYGGVPSAIVVIQQIPKQWLLQRMLRLIG